MVREIYEHSRLLGFDRINSQMIETNLMDLIWQYTHQELAFSVISSGFQEYVNYTFEQRQLCRFIKEVQLDSFRILDPDRDPSFSLRVSRLVEKYNLSKQEVTECFNQVSILDVLSQGIYWNILNIHS